MKKNFGQNFLKNKYIIEEIIKSASINKKSLIYEIGPGDGSLTAEIVKLKPEKLIAIEIDTTLKSKIDKFFNNTSYKIIYGDVMNFDETNLFSKDVTVIGNLPYNISTKLLLKWVHQYYKKAWYKEMILMFQKEVGERILAEYNTKKYGRLTLLCSAIFNVHKVIDVKKENFFPIPKVDSVVLKFTPHKILPLKKNELSKLEYLSKKLFENRRKKLKKKFLNIFNSNDIKKYNIESYFNLRVENLDKEKFFFLSKILN